MEEKKSDQGKHVFQHLIRVTFYYSSANPSLALTHDMESETAFSRKDSYAHYLSYDTLTSSVAILKAMLFQLPWRHTFGGFGRKIKMI